MAMRKLGRSGLTVSPLCFGGNVLGWTADEKTSLSLLDTFVGSGCNFIDTADTYSRWVEGHHGGESETIIGKWLKRSGKRDKIVLATKVGMDMGAGKIGLAPTHIRKSVEDSLRRLQTDYIDLYQSHKDDPNTPQDETLSTYADLIREGKVRAIGASNFSAARLSEALAISAKNNWPRYESLQPEYNLYTREGFEAELAGICRKNEIGVMPYYGLAAGFLTGKYRSEKDVGQSVRGKSIATRYLNERGFRILAALDAVAAANNATPAQVALAWLMTRITAPIASATSRSQLDELLGATRLKLDANALTRLDQASA